MPKRGRVWWTREETRNMLCILQRMNLFEKIVNKISKPRDLYKEVEKLMILKGHTKSLSQIKRKIEKMRWDYFRRFKKNHKNDTIHKTITPYDNELRQLFGTKDKTQVSDRSNPEDSHQNSSGDEDALNVVNFVKPEPVSSSSAFGNEAYTSPVQDESSSPRSNTQSAIEFDLPEAPVQSTLNLQETNDVGEVGSTVSIPPSPHSTSSLRQSDEELDERKRKKDEKKSWQRFFTEHRAWQEQLTERTIKKQEKILKEAMDQQNEMLLQMTNTMCVTFLQGLQMVFASQQNDISNPATDLSSPEGIERNNPDAENLTDLEA